MQKVQKPPQGLANLTFCTFCIPFEQSAGAEGSPNGEPRVVGRGQADRHREGMGTATHTLSGDSVYTVAE